MCIREKHLFHNDIFPHFKCLLSNERLDFCDFFYDNANKLKTAMTVYIYIYVYVYIYIYIYILYIYKPDSKKVGTLYKL